MKLPELKKKFTNKYAIRIVAGVLTVALLGSGMTAVAVNADQNKNAEVKQETTVEDDKDTDLKDLVSFDVSDKTIGKDESVYLLSDANGNVYNTIVSDHLVNTDDAATIEDKSTLSDIKNVKGDEEFKQDGDKLTWQANGGDIYYEGTTDKQVPISETITYYLDGKEIEPEELAGKSGKVTIRFDYENHDLFLRAFIQFI